MSKENPITHAPNDWAENGVEWGAYCRCYDCGLVTTSTMMFDYYADKPGDPLKCENCTLGPRFDSEAIKIIEGMGKEILAEENK